ncbi:hypothetical protein G6F40_016294 [Rhizopus arrhizus]|nr:hypothetical protein G6F40_016294 [Rhizopus arrhizus]
MSCVARDKCTPTPSASLRARNAAPPASSSCTGIRRGANSTTWASRFSDFNALAASSPSSPPPTTTPRRAPLAAARIRSRSSIVRYTSRDAPSAPAIGGTKG